MSASDIIAFWNASPQLLMLMASWIVIAYVWRWSEKRDADNRALLKALNDSYIALVREAVASVASASSQSAENGRAIALLADQNGRAIAALTDQIRGLYDLIRYGGEGGRAIGTR